MSRQNPLQYLEPSTTLTDTAKSKPSIPNIISFQLMKHVSKFATFQDILALRQVDLQTNEAVDYEFIARIISKLSMKSLMEQKDISLYTTPELQCFCWPTNSTFTFVLANIANQFKVIELNQLRTFDLSDLSEQKLIADIKDGQSVLFNSIKESILKNQSVPTVFPSIKEISPVFLHVYFILLYCFLIITATLSIEHTREKVLDAVISSATGTKCSHVDTFFTCSELATTNTTPNHLQTFASQMAYCLSEQYQDNQGEYSIISASIKACQESKQICNALETTLTPYPYKQVGVTSAKIYDRKTRKSQNKYIHTFGYECGPNLSWNKFLSAYGCIIAPFALITGVIFHLWCLNHLRNKMDSLTVINEKIIPETLISGVFDFFTPSPSITTHLHPDENELLEGSSP